jgi:phenylpropionate dioxygenase-like ring-hydroxylating dioxygenase large terminal subunit
MLVTKQPVLKRFWYPVMPIAQISADKPQSFQLLGQKIALWIDKDGKPAAVADQCCHRSAQLSRGVVIDGCIRCPYHGWSYNPEGTCVKVPQLENEKISKSYKVPSYQCVERYGYIWVCLDQQPLHPIPEIAAVTDRSFRMIHEFYETWKVGAFRAIENSFDSAHGHFVHASSWGDQSNPVPPPIDETVETDTGFVMKHWVEVLNPDLQKKNLGIASEKTIRTNERTWYMPFARTLKIQYPNGLIHLIFTAYTPIDDQTTQLVQFCLRNDTEDDAKATDIIAFDRQVTQEDRDVLETTEFDAPLSLAEEQHMPSDKPGIIMRHRLAALLKEHGEVEQRLNYPNP